MMIKPSEVELWCGVLPLVGTLHRVEREVAAAIMIRACVRNEDMWQSVTPTMMAKSLDEDSKQEPWKSLAGNPFCKPDFFDLVKAGYAVFDSDPDGVDVPIRFTQAALDIFDGTRSRKPRRAVYDDTKIVHCLRPSTVSTSPGCNGSARGCSCGCDGCNGRTWVRP
jgi:hypothetical protein